MYFAEHFTNFFRILQNLKYVDKHDVDLMKLPDSVLIELKKITEAKYRKIKVGLTKAYKKTLVLWHH